MGEIPVIQCRNLSRRFGSKTVLNNVSFEVYPGIIGLLGVISTAIARTFSNDVDYYIDAETVKKTELAHFREIV